MATVRFRVKLEARREKSAKLTARGEKVERKEGRMLCHRGRPWGQADEERADLPQSPGSYTLVKAVFACHVIRGVKLEFSSEVLSPSADLFLFRPPTKHGL